MQKVGDLFYSAPHSKQQQSAERIERDPCEIDEGGV
jgi:hypothetical protein